jgi:predicted transcriptional regulator
MLKSTTDPYDGRIVADAMIATPKVLGAEATICDVKVQFENDHVHSVLIVDRGVLLAVVERSDLGLGLSDQALARSAGRLSGRVIDGHEPLEPLRRSMIVSGIRRLAVVDRHGYLVGLLCLKRHGRGFCSAADLQSRANDRQRALSLGPSAGSGGLG